MDTIKSPLSKLYTVGDRVELHPATDLWMRGARYGTITSLGSKLLRVHVDKINRVIYIAPRNIQGVI